MGYYPRSVELDFTLWTVEGVMLLANSRWCNFCRYVDSVFKGGDNFEDSEIDPMIGYGKMSGEGVDYVMTYSDSYFQGRLMFPFGENLTASASLGLDDGDTRFGVGIAFKY